MMPSFPPPGDASRRLSRPCSGATLVGVKLWGNAGWGCPQGASRLTRLGLGLWALACSPEATTPKAPDPPARALADSRAKPLEAPPATSEEPAAPASPEPVADPGRANTDPSDDAITGPPEAISDCAERLEAAGVKFRPGAVPVRQQPGGHVCGAEQVVIYEHGPGQLTWSFAPVVTCQLALGLARFEALVQEEASRELGIAVKRIVQGGTYSCRKMARFALVSEHSYANAIDVRGFELVDGKVITVKKHFGALDGEPDGKESRFLRKLANRAFDEGVFSVVLTPYWDALHADHFHVDQARYRVDGTRGKGAE